MNFKLEPLPFSEDALAPHISERTISIHYHKHHQGYVKKLDKELDGNAKMRDKPLEAIIRSSDGKIFNFASQIWNHSFYWKSLDPNGSTLPSDTLKSAIDASFGSISKLQDELKSVAAGEFGSGWGWLVADEGRTELKIISTTDAESPLQTNGLVPLLTVDVWEHAYYLDYQNERGTYLNAVVDNLLNWNFANENFARL